MLRKGVNIICLFIICAVFLPGIICAQHFNRPHPPVVAPYEFKKYDTACHGYFLTAPVSVHPTRSGDGRPVQPEMILDCNGYIVWYATKSPTVVNSLFNFFPKQNLFSFCALTDSVHYTHYLLDTSFNPVDSVTTIHGVRPDGHEFQILPNGNLLLTGRLDSMMDLRNQLFNGTPGAQNSKAMGFVLQEFTPDHRLVFQWNSNDFIDPMEFITSYGYSEKNFDYCHGNAVALCGDGNYLISFRNLDAIYKIDRATGKILWRLGGKSNSFRFTQDEAFSGQHDVRELSNGNITLFDNANSSPQPQQSRGVEYQLDTSAFIATRVWSTKPEPKLYASGMGNLQTTGTGVRLVNYGLIYRPNPSISLVDENRKVLSEFFFKDSCMSYRSYIFDLPFNLPRPEIKAKKTSKGILLSAPAGYKSYLWSNGKKGSSIEVSKSGVYQVYVNFGIGMLGSKPHRVSELAIPKTD